MISIVIPLYNSENYIADTIYSCLHQTYNDIEIIVVDDCSTDGSARIVEELAKNDTRVGYFCNSENSGVIHTINTGLKLCHGQYVIVLGNDDILEKDHIEIYLKYLEQKKYSFLYCSSNLIDENGKVFGQKIFEDVEGNYKSLARRNTINACGAMINYELLSRVGLYPEELGFRNCGEWYLWIELLQLGEGKYVDNVRSKYRIHKDNLTKKLYSKNNIQSTRDYSCLCMKSALELKGVSFWDKIVFSVYRGLYYLKMTYRILKL